MFQGIGHWFHFLLLSTTWPKNECDPTLLGCKDETGRPPEPIFFFFNYLAQRICPFVVEPSIVLPPRSTIGWHWSEDRAASLTKNSRETMLKWIELLLAMKEGRIQSQQHPNDFLFSSAISKMVGKMKPDASQSFSDRHISHWTLFRQTYFRPDRCEIDILKADTF